MLTNGLEATVSNRQFCHIHRMNVLVHRRWVQCLHYGATRTVKVKDVNHRVDQQTFCFRMMLMIRMMSFIVFHTVVLLQLPTSLLRAITQHTNARLGASNCKIAKAFPHWTQTCGLKPVCVSRWRSSLLSAETSIALEETQYQ